jgi:hypothetical protein
VFPNEKEEGAEFVELLEVFPKLNELFELALLLVLLPKLNCAGEFVFPKLPPKVVVLAFELGVPNELVGGVEKVVPNVLAPAFPNTEGVEVDD